MKEVNNTIFNIERQRNNRDCRERQVERERDRGRKIPMLESLEKVMAVLPGLPGQVL